jgi:hypothetical protein
VKIKAMLKDVDVKENNAKTQIVQKYSLACPRIKL